MHPYSFDNPLLSLYLMTENQDRERKSDHSVNGGGWRKNDCWESSYADFHHFMID